METPAIGDIWLYNHNHGYHYLILDVYEAVDRYSGERALHTTMLCINNGEIFSDYRWPNHTWEKVA